jgi:hypothetical protein
MECCQWIESQTQASMPFGRTVATEYYDGPIQGFVECSVCGKVYSFLKLDWDDSQDVRIFSFAPLGILMDKLIHQLESNLSQRGTLFLASNLSGTTEELVRVLLGSRPTRIVAVEGWPGRCLASKKASALNMGGRADWFQFLGIRKNDEG